MPVFTPLRGSVGTAHSLILLVLSYCVYPAVHHRTGQPAKCPYRWEGGGERRVEEEEDGARARARQIDKIDHLSLAPRTVMFGRSGEA